MPDLSTGPKTNFQVKEPKKCQECHQALIVETGKSGESFTMASQPRIQPTVHPWCHLKKLRKKNLQSWKKSLQVTKASRDKKRLLRERKLQRLKEQKIRAKDRHARSIKGRRKLKKEAEILLHLLIRKQAINSQGNASCYTCKTVKPFAELEAGHRYHNRLDLDTRNLHVQCTKCNHYLSGNLGEYEHRLVIEHGLEWVQELRRDANNPEKSNYTYEYLITFIQQVKEKLKQL